jgi:hypothetical protein
MAHPFEPVLDVLMGQWSKTHTYLDVGVVASQWLAARIAR